MIGQSIAEQGVAAWHAYMDGGADADILRSMIAEDAVFHSPVVHTPQVGRDKVFAYLFAASKVLGSANFAYVREIIDGDTAMLEFTDTIDGIHINGVDLIRWNDAGEIVDFKVMVRPLKAVNKLWEMMGAMMAKAE
ncbi:MAG: nuclear transport factor 2 family protein [Sphingopyxis sp.]